MPDIEEAVLNDDALLWQAVGQARDGRFTVKSVPESVCVQWNDTQATALDRDGNVVAIDAQVKIACNVPPGSIMWHGTLDDLPGTGLTPISGIMEVASVQRAKDIKGQTTAYQLGLKRYRDTLPQLVN
jgi:hypothetical protein